MTIQSVILDLDGTLIDSAAGVQDSVQFAIAEVLPQHPFDRCKVKVGPPIREMARNTFPDIAEDLIDRIAISFRKHYDSVGWRNMVPYEGAVDVLARFRNRGIPLYLATNKPLAPTCDILQQYGMAQYFTEYVCIDSTKPPFAGKADMLLYLGKQHGLEAGATAYVGDTNADFEAAVRCGMPFVFASFGYGAISGTAFRTIATLKELTPEWLR
ncbi:MAG: hypothetical protein JWO95_3303 [Verrucomicrobiales bacterium]|nr:hypothetical protein [Verrucomicrobiales bacterium]